MPRQPARSHAKANSRSHAKPIVIGLGDDWQTGDERTVDPEKVRASLDWLWEQVFTRGGTFAAWSFEDPDDSLLREILGDSYPKAP